MAKLCYKLNGTVKKYDLKDSASTPRLGIKVGGTTKYLGLQQGTKSGEIEVKVNGLPYFVKIMDLPQVGNAYVTPFAFTQSYAHRQNSSDNDTGLFWPFINSDGVLVAAIVYMRGEGNHAYSEMYRGGVASHETPRYLVTTNHKFIWIDNPDNKLLKYIYLDSAGYQTFKCGCTFNGGNYLTPERAQQLAKGLKPASDWTLYSPKTDNTLTTTLPTSSTGGTRNVSIQRTNIEETVNEVRKYKYPCPGYYHAGGDREDWKSIFFVEFPYAGFTGAKPYDLIDAWYDYWKDVDITSPETDGTYFLYNNILLLCNTTQGLNSFQSMFEMSNKRVIPSTVTSKKEVLEQMAIRFIDRESKSTAVNIDGQFSLKVASAGTSGNGSTQPTYTLYKIYDVNNPSNQTPANTTYYYKFTGPVNQYTGGTGGNHYYYSREIKSIIFDENNNVYVWWMSTKYNVRRYWGSNWGGDGYYYVKTTEGTGYGMDKWSYSKSGGFTLVTSGMA